MLPSLALIVGIAAAVLWITRSPELPEPMNPEAARLIAQAVAAIHRADYIEAERLGAQALTMSSHPEHVEFYASIMLSLGRLEEALGYYRSLFKSWKPGAALVIVQRYVTILHRMGLVEERQSVWVAIKDHVPWNSPWQCPDQFDESLPPARPFHNASDYRVTRRIEANMATIHEELVAYLQRQAQSGSELRAFIPNQDIDLVDGYQRESWNELLLFENGKWKEDLCGVGRPFHRTCKPLRGLPEIEGRYRGFKVGQVSFLMLRPGTHLVPHFGTVNWRLVASCGVIVPPGITLKVGQELGHWTNDKCVLFDDTYLHEVWHNGTEPRYVFFANFLTVDSE